MYSDCSLNRMFQVGSLLCLLLIVGLSGCGAAETAAAFAAGSGSDNPLNGGVISDDGSDFTLTTDGGTLSKVENSNGSELGFDRGLTETSQVAAVNRIVTPDGNSADYDADRQVLTVTANFPIVGQQQFAVPTGDLLDNVFGGVNQRARNQDSTDCEAVVGAVNSFCDLFQANVEQTLQQVISLALTEAASAGIPELAFGAIESLITDFFDVIKDFCDAWDEMIAGTDTTAAIDPCDSAP